MIEVEDDKLRLRLFVSLLILLFMSSVVLAWVFAGWRTTEVKEELREMKNEINRVIYLVGKSNEEIKETIKEMNRSRKIEELELRIKNIKVGLRAIASEEDLKVLEILEQLEAIEEELEEMKTKQPEYDKLVELIDENHKLIEQLREGLESGEYTIYRRSVIYYPIEVS